MSRPDHEVTIVVFDVCGYPYALDTAHVREVTAWLPPRPLPGSSTCIEGVINLRGEVIPVCDLARSLGVGTRGEPTLDTAIVVCEIDDGWVGFVVDSVRAVHPSALSDRVESSLSQRHEAIEGIVRGLDDELVVLLRPGRELAGGLDGLADLIAALGDTNFTPHRHHPEPDGYSDLEREAA